jgi:hypothetical protein
MVIENLKSFKKIFMNIREKSAEGKNKIIFRRAAIFLVILAAGGAVYFFSGNSAIAVRSFREAFGLLPGTVSEEIAVQNISVPSSLSVSGSLGETADDAAASGTEHRADEKIENKNATLMTSVAQPDLKKSANENTAEDLKTDDAPSDTPEAAGEIISDGADLISENNAPSSTDASSSVPVVSVSPSSTVQKSSSKKTVVARCSFPTADSSAATHQIILNEIAWMGSPAKSGASAAGASNNEWMEIKNETSSTIPLAGWELIDSVKNITIAFGDGDAIAPSALYLLERTDDDSVPGIAADTIYSGSLPNTGDTIGIFDPSCGASDILDASDGWPGGDNSTKQTLERDATGFGWHTSANPGGTPKAENSAGAAPSVLPVAQAVSSSSIALVQSYMVSATISGDGAGKITSDPAGISCGSYCESSYALGKKVKLHETPGSGVIFSGWTGPCSGTAPDCVFIVTGYVSATAIFHNAFLATVGDAAADDQFSISPSDSGDSVLGPDDGAAQSSSTPSALGHLVIAAVQIAGASSTNDFVKIYNPESAAVDISGWKLHKKSSTGTDYSLKEMPSGTSVPAGGYFTWANSAGGFSESVNADVSSTETLSADNSVALIDANGTVADAVAWGTGVNQYMEGIAYPTDPAANQTLVRIFQNGVVSDTDDNAADFMIQ